MMNKIEGAASDVLPLARGRSVIEVPSHEGGQHRDNHNRTTATFRIVCCSRGVEGCRPRASRAASPPWLISPLLLCARLGQRPYSSSFLWLSCEDFFFTVTL